MLEVSLRLFHLPLATMSTPPSTNASPFSERELVLVRETHIPAAQLFAGWTQPELMVHWFCPKPWFITDVTVDLRVGGGSEMTMCGPEGERFPNRGVYLEIVPDRKLVFTDAYTADWEPSEGLMFTGILTFEPLPSGGTRYTARVRHWSTEACQRHAAMGFHEGWGKAFDQLVELCESSAL